MHVKEQVLKYLENIKGIDEKARKEAMDYSASLLKIPMSLGRIEEIAFQLAGITGKVKNSLQKKCILVMSSDNGITDCGVSSAPKAVTKTMTECFSKYVTGVGVFAKMCGADVIVYNVGNELDIEDPKVINRLINRGTRNFTLGPAMTEEELYRAVLVGIEAVKDAVDKGYQVIGTGEMGIGNTSTTTAVICALTNSDVEGAVGKGTGMTDEASYINKIHVIKKGLEVNKPDTNNPFDVVQKVGGFDIAALMGVYIGCAYYRIPAVIDGYISSAAAFAAYRLNPVIRQYMIESHFTEEIGYRRIQDEMHLRPIFMMNMRLGEGSGCPFTFFAIDCANSMMNNMYTFEQGMISQEYVDKVEDLKF